MPTPSAAGLSRALSRGASPKPALLPLRAGRPGLPKAGKVTPPPRQGSAQGSGGSTAGTPGSASIEGLSAADFQKHREKAAEGSFKKLVGGLRAVPIPANPEGQGFPERRGKGGHPLRAHPAFLRIWQQLKAQGKGQGRALGHAHAPGQRMKLSGHKPPKPR